MVRPRLSMNVCRLLWAVVACLGMLAESHGEEAPPFPTDPNSWINSGPLSVDALKGKGIVLWFFEEDDTSSAARWTPMLEASNKFAKRQLPVVFIAVNSGSPRAKVDAYLKQLPAKVTWPVLVDTSRDFEKACGLFQEVNDKNVSVIRYIKPDGEIQTSVTEVIEDVAEKALEGAKWKVEPNTIPDSLKPMWLAVEIGNYKGIAANLKKSTSSPKPDIKDASTKLMEIVQKEIDDQMAKIKEAQEATNPYRAFELLNELTEHFNGFELPKDVATLKKDLPKDAKVKAGQAAVKVMEMARKQMGANGLKPKNKAALEKLIAEFPDTNLAKQAKALIDYAP